MAAGLDGRTYHRPVVYHVCDHYPVPQLASDEIGGVAWLAMDNVATSIYIPVYCCVTDLPQPYKTPGRTKGFTRESAMVGVNYLGTLAAQPLGEI